MSNQFVTTFFQVRTILENIVDILLIVLLRSIPHLFSLILSANKFNFTTMVRGIEMNKEYCESYDKQEKKEIKDRWKCFRPGSIAISVIIATITLAISILLSSYLSNQRVIKDLGLVSGFILVGGSLLYSTSYGSEIFLLSKKLNQSPRKIFQKIGKHPALYLNVLIIFLSIIFQGIIIYFD